MVVSKTTGLWDDGVAAHGNTLVVNGDNVAQG